MGEGFYTRTQMKSDAKGRPSIPVFALSSAAIVGALTLINQSESTAKPGLALGLLASAILFLSYLRRIVDTEHNPRQWPGPKAWPSTLLLISFFSVNIFGQALLKSIQV
ncbi:hypothetical protein WJX73_008894 [Symbiochloris irregularis]|uniref:Uncharacterized protein n=1 Tax=Symbiochloris irregularis TaxID=706552 RepID=A0AAW1NVE0_9CHLO